MRTGLRPASWSGYLLALLGGALHALAFSASAAGQASNVYVFWPGWIAPVDALPGLLQIGGVVCLFLGLTGAVWTRPVAWRAAAMGWLFATAWFAGSLFWLYISMHRYGGLPAPLAALAVLALAGFMALFMAAASVAFVRWRRGGVGDALLFAALWLLAELVRGRWLTGLPWASAGYAHVDGPLAALAPYVGVYGMGCVAALVACAVARAWQARGVAARALWAVAALALWAAPLALRHDFTTPTGTLAVTLIQGNVPQDEKFDPVRLPEALDWHVRALFAAQGDLVLAGETAIPLLPSQMPEGYWPELQRQLAARPTAALFGVPLGDFDTGYTNSAIGLGAGVGNDKPAYRYDKHHLVPFGEFIPTGFRWFVAMMNIPLGDFNRGPLVAPSMPVRGERVAPNICYEDLFGEELAARFIETSADAAQAPTVLANLSNIGWFGHTVAISQHLQISRLRTLELQRPMLRATNTGATVAIDHQGLVRAALMPHTQGVLTARVQGREGVTPYAAWAGRWGLWPLWAVGLVGATVAGWRRRGRATHR